jgi:hypothetical protein
MLNLGFKLDPMDQRLSSGSNRTNLSATSLIADEVWGQRGRHLVSYETVS